jgi:leader peptidase (prepilin peptidase) / N-methyltransferase
MLVTGALWIVASAVTALALDDSSSLPMALLFVGLMAILIRRDLRSHRLPRGVLIGGLIVIALAELVTSLTIDEPSRLIAVIGGATAACVSLMIAHRAVPGGPGFGDAAFAGLLGGVLGWYGPDRVVLGLGLGLVLAAVAAGPITLALRRQLVASSPAITLRPALAAGAWLTMCWGDTILLSLRAGVGR